MFRNDVLLNELGSEVRRLRIGGFVVVEYVGAAHVAEPYSQVMRDNGGFYCEVVSDHYLSSQVWPLDRRWLIAGGWAPPDLSAPSNWWRQEHDASIVAEVLVAALQRGRRCPDPEAFLWYSDGPSPHGGGEPLPRPCLGLPRAS